MEVVDQSLLLEVDESGKMRECNIIVLEIGVICFVDSPKDRMEIRDTTNKLRLIKNLFLKKASP